MKPSLAERAKTFEEYLDSIRDKDGLVLSGIKADELRPWRDEDLKSFDIWENWAHDPSGCLSYEDCLMATGRYIGAKVLKHLAAGGDSKTLADAERSARAILAVSREGDKSEDGFLPKPFGGLSKASLSKNTSNDQYEHALFGLWTFRRACPNSGLIPEIESAIVRWTEYFIRRDFSYLFHGYIWVCTDPMDRSDGMPVTVGRHSLGLYFPLCAMSYQISGNAKYLDLLHRRLLPSLRRWLADPKLGFSGHSNSCNLLGQGLYFCWKNDIIREEAAQAVEMCCAIAESRLSKKDGLEYDYAHVGVTDENQIEPHFLDRPLPSDNWKWGLWISNAKGASSTITAHLDALALRIRPGRGRSATIHRILDHFVSPGDMTHLIDFDGRQVPPEYGWTTNDIVSVCPAAWLQAYYLMSLPMDMDGL